MRWDAWVMPSYRQQFSEGYNKFFVPCTDGMMERLLQRLDPSSSNRIDYIEWSNTLTLDDIPDLTRYPPLQLTSTLFFSFLCIIMISMRHIYPCASPASPRVP